MKKLYLLIIVLLTFSCNAQNIHCSNFKTGKFKYVDKYTTTKIVRTEHMQIETNPETGVKIYCKIEWITDCEYVMTYEKIENYPEDVSNIIGKKIYIEILETQGNRLTVHAKSDTMDEIIKLIKTDEN